MKNLFCRLTQAPVDAPVTYSHDIYQNCSPFADTPTGYSVSKNQKSRKQSMLPMLAATSMLFVLLFVSNICTLNAQAPVVETWANLNGQGPITLKVDANGTFYSGCDLGRSISRVTSAGVVTAPWVTLTNFAQPFDIAFDNDGNLYTANKFNNANNNTISKITPAGVVTQVWATLAVGAYPTAITTDENGNVYVTNSRLQTVSKITPAGAVTQTWATLASTSFPEDIIRDANGNFYTANNGNGTISKITPAGVVTQVWASLDALAGPFQLVFDNNGNLYSANMENNTVSKITPAGIVTEAWATLVQRTPGNPTSGAGPRAIAFDIKSGSIFTANLFNNTVSKIKIADSSVIQNWLTGFNEPASLVVHQDYLYIADYSATTIRRVLLPGAFDVNFNQTSPTCSNSTDGGLRAIPSVTCGTAYQFLWTPGGATTDTISNLAPGTYNVRVVCGTDTVNKSITLTAATSVAAPSTSNQSLCSGATVADLVATPLSGNTIKWYATTTGGTALANSTPLVNATKYYAAQVTPSNCESSIRAVDSVTIQATVAAKADSSYCNGSSIAVNFVGASGNTYNWTATQNGTGIAASGTGNTSFTGVNNTNAVVTDTVMVSSSFNTCTPQRDTFAISVLPTPLVDSIADMWVCPSTVVPAINFTTPITGGTVGYKWTNNNTAIGLAASGFGNIPSFTSPATTQNTFRSTINVRPYILKSATDTCFGVLRTFTITSGLPPFVLLGGRFQTRVIYTGSKTINQLDISPGAGFTLNYYYQPTGGTALPGTTPVVDDTTYYVTRALAGCESNPRKIVPVNRIANDTIVFCKPDSVANLTATTAANITARWYNEPSFGDTLASSTPITAALDTLYVEEYGMYQPGRFAVISNRVPVIVMVNPTPANVVATTDKAVCNNSTVAAVNFSTTNTVGATTYAWTNNKPGIGLAATGTGNIASFTAVNNGTVPDTATIIVTPTITNLGLSCEGIKDTFLIVVNPSAVVNAVNNQVVCNGSAVTAINFGTTNTGGTVTYAWTNNTTSIGLAANGTGNIATFTGVNTGTAPVTATIVVTPTFTNGGVSCAGPTKTFTITVNPSVTVNPENDQVVCNGAGSTAINFSTTATGGTTTYTWTNNTTSIGLAASGTGIIPAFTTVNNGTAPVTAPVIVTPTFANGGQNCVGAKDTFYIVVNPTAKINAIADKAACNGSTVVATMPTSTATGGTVTYTWTNNTTSIGLAASGTGAISSFTATNTGSTAITATIIVTPTFTNGGVSCVGTNDTFNITVNPPPTFAATADKYVCNASATTAVVFSTALTGGTAVYHWTNSNTTIGLAATGTGNVPSFTATNNTIAPIMGSIVVYMDYTNAGLTCTSLKDTFNYVVNPTAVVNSINDQVLCNGAAVSAMSFSTTASGGITTYAWTNDKPGIGLAATGTGNIAAFTAVNNSATPDTATIIVTPTFANGGTSCEGVKDTIYIVVNPTAVVNAVNNQTVCAGSTNSAITFSSPVAGTTYSWTNSNPSVGLAASGIGNVPSFVAVNPSPNAINATITVTPNTPAGCIGQSITYTITVNGWSVAPASINNPTPIVCANNAFTTLSVNGGALGSGAVWKWYADSLNTVSIGSGATLSNIPVAKTTTYFVRAEGTCNNTAAASVVVQRANLVSHVRQHWSDVLLFDNSSKNYVAWQWYKNGVAVNGATLQQYSESSALAGTYYVVATDKNGAQSVSCPLTITAGSFTGLKIGMFPNPADKGANVMVTTSFTVSELQGANITVTDVYGRVLQQITQVTANTAIKAPATTGIYVVTLTLQSGIKYSANLLTK